MGHNLEITGTGKVLNRTLLAHALRSTITVTSQNEKLLHSKGHHHFDKMAAYKIGYDFHQAF